MNVDHHQKYCHPIKVKEASAAATATAANVKGGRRRRLLLTREVSNLSNCSLEAEYHAQEPAAVPFVWESCPGTPKRHVIMRSSCHELDHEILLPPLTPPPSYYQHHNQVNVTRIRSSKKKKQNDANVNLIQTIFPRLSFKKDQPSALSSSSSTKSSSPTSTSSSSSSSSSPSPSQARSVMSTPSPTHRHRLSFQYSRREVEEEDEVGSSGSPVSTLCFRRLSCCNRRFRGLYSSWF